MIAVMAKRGIAEVMRFCFYSGMGTNHELDEKGLQIAMRKFVAICWLTHSEFMVGANGEPLTLQQLGAIPQLDCTKVALSLVAQKFAGQFGFHARIQKRRGSKANYAASAKTGWAKRRARAKRTKRK